MPLKRQSFLENCSILRLQKNIRSSTMEALEQELTKRKDAIKKELELLFKANMKITDWDIPEVDDKEVAQKLIAILKEAVGEIEQDIVDGKYDTY